MDPNETLRRARNIAARAFDGGASFELAELAEAFQDLDEWIMKGGFLPSQWEANRPKKRTKGGGFQ